MPHVLGDTCATVTKTKGPILRGELNLLGRSCFVNVISARFIEVYKLFFFFNMMKKCCCFTC